MITKKIYTGFIIAIISIFSFTSVAFADEPKDKSSNEVLSRAAEILGVDVVDLENALKNAHAEIREKKHESKLQEFVDSGKITQEDADEINLWRESKPESIKSQRKVIHTMKKEGEFKRLSKEDLASKAYELGFISQLELDEITLWFGSKPTAIELIKPDKKKQRKFRKFRGLNKFKVQDNTQKFSESFRERSLEELVVPRTNI